MNETQKQAVAATQEWLKETFPACFVKNHAKPLKVGILKDIFEKLPEDQSISRLQVRKAVKFYTMHPLYQKALARGEPRVDLEGNTLEKVTEEHQEVAQKAMALRKLKSFVKKNS